MNMKRALLLSRRSVLLQMQALARVMDYELNTGEGGAAWKRMTAWYAAFCDVATGPERDVYSELLRELERQTETDDATDLYRWAVDQLKNAELNAELNAEIDNGPDAA